MKSNLKRISFISLLTALISCGSVSFAQLGVREVKTTFGVQIKPIIPNRFIGEFEQLWEREGSPSFSGSFRQRVGFSAGMIIRHKVTNVFSIETGINFIRRNYDFTYTSLDSGIAGTSEVGFICYDIPINGLVYVRIGQQWYMNASGGLNFKFFPTSVQSFDENSTTSTGFNQITSPRRRIQLGLNINYGFEYRDSELGTFYIGTSYLLPFTDVAVHQMTWDNQGAQYRVREDVSGSFLTLDLKYFFKN